MKDYRAFLMGGVCLGLLSVPLVTKNSSLAREGQSVQAHTGAQKDVIVVATSDGEKDEGSPAAASEQAEAAPPSTPPGTTDYYGETAIAANQPFAAEAKMNPDYVAAAGEAPAPEAPAATEAPAAAEAAAAAPAAEPELPMTPPGTTDYYGATAVAADQPFAAEAKMNPDYTPATATADAPAEAAPVAAAAEPELPMTPPGTTDYYGATAVAADQPFAAEAKMNPDYTPAAETPAEAPAAAPAAAAVEQPLPVGPPGTTDFYGMTEPVAGKPFAAEATMTPAATAPASTEQAVEACRDALNAEAQAGTILFQTSSWDVLPQSFKTLDKIAKIAKDCAAGFVIEVGGHTDTVGKPASNKTISELRAQSVVKYLTRAGVDAAKLKAVGYGQDKPVADNGTPQGRAKNRRIEFLVTAN